jgi:hypothetical protein
MCVVSTRAPRQSFTRINSARKESPENVSNTIHATVCREILLAALQIMCNAAENFLRDEFQVLRTAQDSRGERSFFKCRSVRRVTQGFAAGLFSVGRIVRCNQTGAVLASLTNDGGL